MMVNLARGFALHGHPVDLLVSGHDLPYLDRLGDKVELINLRTSHPRRLSQALTLYLQNNLPAVLLSSKSEDHRLTLTAKSQVYPPPRVYLRIGTHLSGTRSLRSHNPLRRWLHRRQLQRLCYAADGVICVSEGVAADLVRLTGSREPFIRVIRNPVVTPELAELAKHPVDHPWFAADQPPVIVAIGRLARVKCLDLLLRAVARIGNHRPSRVVLIGQGREQDSLLELAARLGIADRLQFLGFQNNPYAYMARADLLVLSSEREGSPNVLAEALAVGTPVVATDCPSGPREILAQGRYGRLVPVGDEEAMADAILETLDNPPNADFLKTAMKAYTLEYSSKAYLDAFGL